MSDDEIKATELAALELMGNDQEAAEKWLNSPIDILGSMTPLEHVKKHGNEDVLELIGRLQHGVFS